MPQVRSSDSPQIRRPGRGPVRALHRQAPRETGAHPPPGHECERPRAEASKHRVHRRARFHRDGGRCRGRRVCPQPVVGLDTMDACPSRKLHPTLETRQARRRVFDSTPMAESCATDRDGSRSCGMHLVLHLLRLGRALAADRTRLALENLALRQQLAVLKTQRRAPEAQRWRPALLVDGV